MSIQQILINFSKLKLPDKLKTLELLEKSLKLDPIQILPNEIILHILQFMDYHDLLNIKLLNKTYFNLIKDEHLWYKLYLKEYPVYNNMDYNKFEYYYAQQKHLDSNWSDLNYNGYATKIHSRGIYCVDLSSDIIVCGGRDHLVKVFDLSGTLISKLSGHTASVLCIELATDESNNYSHIPLHLLPVTTKNRIVSGSSDATVAIWDSNCGTLINRFNAHLEAVLNLSVFKNFHTFATCSKDRHVALWDVNNCSSPLLNMDGHQAAVNSVVALQDVVVSAGGDRVIKVWDKRTGTSVLNLVGHDRGIACLDVDLNYVASGSSDKTIRIHDLRMGSCCNVIRVHDELVRTVSINARRQTVVSGSYDSKVILTNFMHATYTNKTLQPTKQPYNVIEYTDDHSSYIRTTERGPGHSSRVFNVAMSNDRIISVSEDNRMIIWDFN
eukprot:NODE_29_length_33183_cov_0.333666.p3 type:complete len:440 gc:universal NODE_29_length_33183_cov_0.333666:12090-13409(+)